MYLLLYNQHSVTIIHYNIRVVVILFRNLNICLH